MGLGNVVVGSGNMRMCCHYNTMQMVPLFLDGCPHHSISLDIWDILLPPVLFLGPRQQRGAVRSRSIRSRYLPPSLGGTPLRTLEDGNVGGGGERIGCPGGGRNRPRWFGFPELRIWTGVRSAQSYPH